MVFLLKSSGFVNNPHALCADRWCSSVCEVKPQARVEEWAAAHDQAGSHTPSWRKQWHNSFFTAIFTSHIPTGFMLGLLLSVLGGAAGTAPVGRLPELGHSTDCGELGQTLMGMGPVGPWATKTNFLGNCESQCYHLQLSVSKSSY